MSSIFTACRITTKHSILHVGEPRKVKMKKLAIPMIVLSVFAFIACSSDSGTESQADQLSQESETDTVELTQQSDISDLEERIAALEAELASLPAGPQGPAGPAGATGAVGATGAAGASGSDGALAGLTCNDEEFVATLSSSWQCAELGVTQGGVLSGTVSNSQCCTIASWVANDGYSAVGLDTNVICDDGGCEFVVVGVADHSICTLSGSVGNDNFTHTSSDVFVNSNGMFVDWFGVLNDQLGASEGDSFSVQITCGQGVVAAQ